MRPLHEIYMSVAQSIALASRANRRKVGCIIVKEHNIISFGFNGTPTGFSNRCELNGKTKKIVLHAEANTIIKCAKSAHSCDGGIMYCTCAPCFDCAKLIIQSGIVAVYYNEDYTDSKGINLLRQAKILVCSIKQLIA